MDLSKVDKQALINELGRRQRIEEEQNSPQLVQNPDLSTLAEACQEYLDLVKKGVGDDGLEHQAGWILEAAIDALFELQGGGDIWDWINDRR